MKKLQEFPHLSIETHILNLYLICIKLKKVHQSLLERYGPKLVGLLSFSEFKTWMEGKSLTFSKQFYVQGSLIH